MTQELNFGDDAPRTDISRLGELSELIAEMEARRERAAIAEAAFDQAKAELAEIEEVKGPALMKEMRTKDFTTAGGVRVKVDEQLEHSLGKDDPARKARALKIMRDLKQGGAIKNMVIAEFSLGEDEKANALLAELRDRGFAASNEQGIHPSTLKSILKQLLKSGVQIPELKETFGAFWRTKLKVVRKG